MHTLDQQDLEAIAQEVIEDWQFTHLGLECPFDMSTAGFEKVRDDEMAFELDLTRRLSPWA